MGASSGALYRVGTATLISGSRTVTGVGSSWISALIAIATGDLFTLDMDTWYEVISVDSDTNITLDRGFQGANVSGANYAILRNTSGTVLTRIAGQIAVQFNQKQLFLDELRTWLNSSNDYESVTDSHGLSHSITTPKKMESDAQELIDNNQVNIDTSVSATIAKIRYSKLDNPLCHLFKKNKLVDTLSGALSWTRASGATYIDRYGKLQYSPSPNATNLALWSEDLSNSAWVKSNVTVTDNASTSYSGLITAQALTDTASNSSHLIQQSFITTDLSVYTFSTLVKRGSKPECCFLATFSGSETTSRGVIYNFDTKQVRAMSEVGIIAPTSFSVTSILHAPGWERLSFTFDTRELADISAVTVKLGLYSEAFSYLGDGNGFVLHGGIQLEKSPVANGHIKTEATSKSGTSYFGIEQARQEKQGWLIEGASTNLVLHCNEISDSAWIKSDVTLATGTESVYGVGSTVKCVASLVSKSVYQEVPVETTEATFTLSVWCKSTGNNSEEVNIGIYDVTNAQWIVDANNSQQKFVGQGSERFKATGVKPLGSTLIRVYAFRCVPARNALEAEIELVQLEKMPTASSVITTIDSAVTRAASDVTIDARDNLPAQGQPFSIVFNVSPIMGVTSVALETETRNQTKGIYLYFNAGTDLKFLMSDGVSLVTVAASNMGEGLAQYELAYDGLTMTARRNGVVVGTAINSSPSYNTDERLYIGGKIGKLNGPMSDFRIYDFMRNADEAKFLAGE